MERRDLPARAGIGGIAPDPLKSGKNPYCGRAGGPIL